MAPIGFSSFLENDKVFLTHTGNPLAAGAVEPFNRMGFTTVLAYRPMAVRRENGLIGLPAIGITPGVFTIHWGQ
jgi:hypothetical protein